MKDEFQNLINKKKEFSLGSTKNNSILRQKLSQNNT